MTERTLDSELKAGAESGVFSYVVLAKLAFPSGTVFIHNGVGTFSFAGDDYLGVGAFGSISVMEDTIDIVGKPISLTLSSIVPEIIDAVTTEQIFGKDADIYIGVLNADGVLQGTPDNWFSGHMEKVVILLGNKDGVKLTLQSRASRVRLRNNKRYTSEDQQDEHPGDLFFEFLPSLMEKVVNWGGQLLTGGLPSDGEDGTIPPGGEIP